jgi:hypothetical protein
MFRSPFLNITFEQINQRVFNVDFFVHNLRDLNREGGEIDPATAAASPDRLTEIRRYRGRAGSSFPFLPRRSALIPSRTLMHGSPWLRASEATRVRRRQIKGLERLGRAIGVLIGVLEFALGKIGVLDELGAMHDFPHYPPEVLNRAARIFGVGGYMLGERLLLRRAASSSPSWMMTCRHFRGGGTSAASTFASIRSIREALRFIGARPLARSICPVASNSVGDLVHAGFELL